MLTVCNARFVCSVCSDVFHTGDQLELHHRSEHIMSSKQHQPTNIATSDVVPELRQTPSILTSSMKLPQVCPVALANSLKYARCQQHVSNQDTSPSSHVKKPSSCEDEKDVKFEDLIIVEIDCEGNNEQTFLCSMCSTRFRYKYTCKRHLQTVHRAATPKPFPCTLCTRILATRCTLKNHMLSIHNVVVEQKTFSCCICGKLYGYGGGLRRHMKMAHNLTK